MTNKEMKKVGEWKDAQRIQILDSGTITGLVAYQVNAVMSDPKASEKDKETIQTFVQNFGYIISKGLDGSYTVTKIQVPNMNWEQA